MATRLSAQVGAKASAGICVFLVVSFLAGCAAGPRRNSAASACPPKTQIAKASANDPMQLLQTTLCRCDALEGYEIVFHRQERRGLLSKLSDWEDIKVCYRKQPSAVKMIWLDPASEYQECVYVEGLNDGKVTVLPRKGLFGLPAAPLSVPPELAVTLGKSLRPITEFGLAFMIRHTLARLEEAKASGGAQITYAGLALVDKSGVKAHHVTAIYPKGFGRSGKQDLYIDAETGYPAGSYLWQPNGELLAAYVYEKPTLVVPADEVFAIGNGKTLAAGK